MTSSFVSLPRAAALSVAITVLASSIATAQTTASTASAGPTTQSTLIGVPAFARQLQGKNVWITADGVRRRGFVKSLSTTGLVLIEDGAATTIPFSPIIRVEKSSHRLRNGTLIGLASGAALGFWAADGFCDGDCPGPVTLLFSGLFGGIGAAAGVGIGAIVNAAKRNGDVLYDARRSTTTLTLTPILSPTRKGLAFSMTWR